MMVPGAVSKNWRKAAEWAGGIRAPEPTGPASPLMSTRYARGSKRLKYTAGGVGAFGVFNAARGPSSSGRDGMMPQSSGGMTGY